MNISRKTWGGEGGTKPLTSKGKKKKRKTNKQTKETSSSLIDFHGK
jgi:hypothetical protein